LYCDICIIIIICYVPLVAADCACTRDPQIRSASASTLPYSATTFILWESLINLDYCRAYLCRLELKQIEKNIHKQDGVSTPNVHPHSHQRLLSGSIHPSSSTLKCMAARPCVQALIDRSFWEIFSSAFMLLAFLGAACTSSPFISHV
jgi:hypothetical protein